jgi:antitoxin HicB
MVTFPDFPEAQTFGDDEADALARAGEALATIIDGYIRARRPLPVPSATLSHAAELSPLMNTKVELYALMQALGVSKADLARRLDWHAPQVDRLLNLTHSSQVDQLDAAIKVLGGRLRMGIDGIPIVRPRMVLGVRPRDTGIAASVGSGRSVQSTGTRSRLPRTTTGRLGAKKK